MRLPVGLLGMTGEELADLHRTGRWPERTIDVRDGPLGFSLNGWDVPRPPRLPDERPDPKELAAALREWWRIEGKEEGRIEGKEEGRIEGKEEGRIEGKEEGRIEGKQEGRIEGKEEGRVEGKEEGRVEGKEEGRIEGKQEGRREAKAKAHADLRQRAAAARQQDVAARRAAIRTICAEKGWSLGERGIAEALATVIASDPRYKDKKGRCSSWHLI
jgi:hypothetical protein